MACSDCKYWKQWSKKQMGDGTYLVGDCFECSFAKTFGKSVRPHDGDNCPAFEAKEVSG